MAGPPHPSPTRPSAAREVGSRGEGGRGSSVCLTPTYTGGPGLLQGSLWGGGSRSEHVGRKQLCGPFLGAGLCVNTSLSVSPSLRFVWAVTTGPSPPELGRELATPASRQWGDEHVSFPHKEDP